MTNNQKLLKRQKIRNAEYYDMQNVFDEMYEQSNRGNKFTHLIELIQRPENIRLAYRNIRKNHGSRTAGTDNQTIKELNRWTESALIAHVQKKFQWYIPKSVRRVEIPKGNGQKRSLGIPTIMDRLIQQCILQVLEPICEAKFFKRNNGFRPNRSVEHAIAQAERFMQNMNCHYVVDIDIKSFFDNVNHGKLLKQMWTMGIQDKKLLSILSSMLKAEIAKIGFPEKGTPQGGIISPLLSNIVLNELDWWIVSQWEEMPTKTKYVQRVYSNGTLGKRSEYRALRNTNLKECYIVRYADDFKIFCKTRADAKRLFEATKQWLKKRLGLEVSPEKSKIVNLKRHYTEFLGFKLKVHPKGKKRNGSPKFVVKARMKKQALAKIHEKSKSIIKRLRQTYNKDMEYKWIQLYNAHIIGVHNYYSIATHVNLDFKTIAFDVKKSIYNRLKHKLHKDGVITNKYIKEKYGKSKEVRFISGIPIVPIAYVQHRVPLDKKKKINKYTLQGRLEIHKNLEGEYVQNLYYLMKRPVGGRSVEFNDNRIALFVAQRGNCAVMGTPLDVKKTDCHHIIRSKDGGDDSYQNLVVVSSAIHELLHATSTTIIQKYLKMFTPNKKQLAKINKYREILNLELLA
ncbi:group II intron reverse transcriptase/maturase [Enterococcus raffinosus]|uniref:group II intron reverse transcriptase/maturase n=1 Tax=Enterococcus TaxID=1350 RepID=UPI00288E1B6D|nr:group II intron reverse transcriptase/maturase [Enterococcus raffinosus]MDT2525944.1 group II intron reverse transcriptase/maturase [Enterococcus raffinosus]MDT2536439.1 group II intron reverse transcriptase/maturase [Enterococcus raffinosus]MDT2580386.1 group II intron reverse transcriptase/maturase [Enterococcus raffinosus]MDT2593227.1 group II intron reverse transcriptase/maturase [Enterococcus raffinosus]